MLSSDLQAEHKNGLPVPDTWEYYTQQLGRAWEQATAGGCPCPYSLAAIVLPLWPPVQPCQHPHYQAQPKLALPASLIFPCGKRPQGQAWPSNAGCVCRAEDSSTCRMGPEELQPSQHKGGCQQASGRVPGASQTPPRGEEVPATVKQVLAFQFTCTALPSVPLELPPSAWG